MPRLVSQREYSYWQTIFLRHWALFFFLLIAAITTLISKDMRQSVNIQLPLLGGLFLYVLSVDTINTSKKIGVVVLVFVLIMFAQVAASWRALLLVVDGEPLKAVKAMDSFLLIVPNDILVLSVVMPLLLGMAWMGARWLRVLFVCCFLAALIVSEKLQSRQAVVLLLAGQLLVVAMLGRRWFVPAALLLLIVGIVLDGLSGWWLAKKIFLFSRSYVWHAAWVMFLDRTWVGQGPGLFGDVYFAFLAKAGYVLDAMPDRRPMLWAHNLYLEQLAERGVGGLLSLLSLLCASLFYAWRAWSQSHHTSALRGLSAGIFSAVAMLAVSGIAEASLSRVWVAVSLMLLAAFAITADNISNQNAATAISAPATTASNAQE